jgi:1-aminocyclopropane-1-carboxylate deaminase/D-cysteine desulfhydrase-like pyridoxal-dependent ACC family enzyme
MEFILRETEIQNCNALITCGGIQSNHARVTAIAAAMRGWKCHLVLHGDPSALDTPVGNLRLMRLAGATLEIVPAEEIGPRMDAAKERFHQEGRLPAIIPGGGHLPAGAEAYYHATINLEAEPLVVQDKVPDWILLASGTGTTHAGIHCAIEALGWPTRTVGISIARRNPRGKGVVEQSCCDLRKRLRLNCRQLPVDFRDDWVGEGYEKCGPTVWKTIQEVLQKTGILLDPTYTGKAFTGLLQMIDSGEIRTEDKVLFWHTGGLMNLMAVEKMVSP